MLICSQIKHIASICAKGEFENRMKRLLFFVLASLIISSSLPSMASANSTTSLVSTAKSYIGVPYSYGGTTTSGFDCSGFIQYVFKKEGKSLPRTTGQQYNMGKTVAKSALQTGDLVFFNTSGRGVSHAGIYIGANNFIHASTSKGVMISSINDPYYWGKRYIGARRVTDLTPEKAVAAADTVKKVKYATRAEIAETIVKEVGLPIPDGQAVFSDVPADHPQADAIRAVAEAGIFSGNNGEFNPDGLLTRAQMAKVLVETFDMEGTSNANFKDVPSDHWATEYINTLAHNNVTSGYGDGNYGLNDNVTAAQLQKFMKKIEAQ